MRVTQPAVRATALACVVLWRSYVWNSASPAADWGLKVILQPPYRQRTSLAATMPPTHRIARRKSHSEGTFNVLAPCLRGTFNVPPTTCPYGGVRVCTSVARRRCVEGTTHVRRTHGHILPAQNVYSWWPDRFPAHLFGALTLRFGSHLLAELTITLGIISFKTINLWCYQLGKCRYHALR